MPAPDAARDDRPLTRWDRLLLAGLVLLFVAFGVLVEVRAAFLKRRMTDLGVYLRTAWAVRAGEDLYDITDANGWHYQYPPLFAIVLTPLADPPPGHDRAGMLPFAVSAAVWYALSVGCLGMSGYLLAGVLRLRGSRGWRVLFVALLACLTPVLHTLMRGQVSLLLLLLLSAFVASLYRGRSVQAGLWLAGAICLKVIPALLLLFPLWRRDVRCLVGCLVGLVIGLAVVPAAVFGWPRTVQYYVEYDGKVLRPGLGDPKEQARAQELTDTVATDSQSLVALLHNTLHRDRATRPRNASPEVRRLHWLIGGALLALTLLAPVGRSQLASGRDGLIFLGLLLFNMLLLSPVCHLHYFSLLLPLTAGLTAAWWERQLPRGWQQVFPALLLFQAVAGLLPVIPGLEPLRDLGLATYGAAPLWLAGCMLLRQRRLVSAVQFRPAALAA